MRPKPTSADWIGRRMAFGALLAGLVLSPARLQPQSPKASGAKGLPRTADGKPDFSGVYEWPKSSEGERCKCSATVFRPQTSSLRSSPAACLFLSRPPAIRAMMSRASFACRPVFRRVCSRPTRCSSSQNKNYLVIVHEFQRMTRIIPLDGRPHRKGIEPTYFGDPVGHWEGDTLVVESTNFKRWGLDDYYYSDKNQYRMHSDALARWSTSAGWTTRRFPTSSRSTIRKFSPPPGREDFTMALHPDWDAARAVRIRLRREQPLSRRKVQIRITERNKEQTT